MSKVSAMQAMREARYSARPPVKPAVPPSPAAVPAAAAEATAPSTVGPGTIEPELALLPAQALSGARVDRMAPDPDGPPAEALCGHRSMNNRDCRRPAGHQEKNHRYS